MRTRILAIVLSCLVSTGSALAAVITATGSGWINSTGTPNATGFDDDYFYNKFAGWTNNLEYHNWFSFVLPAGEITDATLFVWNDWQNPSPAAVDPDATFHLYAASDFTFAGLTTGASLGSVRVADANTGVNHFVGIDLNAAGLSVLATAQGGRVSFGGSITTTYPDPATTELFAFGWSVGTPAAYLRYNVIPEPETYAALFAGLGLVGAMILRWRQHRAR